jgi:simple sugar transport system ATP-binding protein
LAISDRISILRAGSLIKTILAKATNQSELTSLIVEGFVPSLMIDRGKVGDPILLVEGLTVKGDRGDEAVKNVSFTLHAGEILGVAGVTGNGQKELVEAITGLRKSESGKTALLGCDMANKPPKFAINKGISYIPEDRMKRGVILNMTVSENLALKSIEEPPYSKRMMVDKKAMDSSAEGLIRKFGIKASDSCAMTSSLSGGNIQKLVVARELTQKSQVVVAEQPTAGLDVKASQAVHESLLGLRGKGAGIILISSDLDEVIKLSDRILVIFGGKFVGEFTYRDLDLHKLAKMMLGSEA